jgi:hypothetical protein
MPSLPARHRPSSEFLAPSTVCSPSGLADSLGPLPLMGFSLATLFRTGRPRCIAATAAPSHPRCSTPSNSEEYEVESSADSKALEPARSGSTAVVPERPNPLRSTSFPVCRKSFRSCSSPRALEPSASGRALSRKPRRVGPAPQGVSPARKPADLREIRSSHGVLAAIRKTLWRLPVCDSVRHRHAHRSWKFSGCHPRKTPGTVARAARPFHVTGLSKIICSGSSLVVLRLANVRECDLHQNLLCDGKGFQQRGSGTAFSPPLPMLQPGVGSMGETASKRKENSLRAMPPLL